ncbi:hypothetical protein [Rhizobium hidalgonense]|uniref:Uncharacterized protein n=1 Tax=Rhizobium hidalgonense TaxID=1538159 RepID=A0A2A6K2L4_9HYPH|nr:hypothetical protein [Rhizobium hidalgonense]EJC73842.1 hypothetical protein Rleg10DRAFT_2310 [Rhizobium leguminosarum bv. trifolii WSM2012]MDR9777585.1 hypothetical protein [Rhizobium hidalgonense]MDR9807933.1 hypothetical protein [Rhizobium hidalgonense]MDR9813137.1 hypothetical protein [Rhizobium hidalgonense]MDR9823928.1 hypothetical protein [Rhizobium hidalgonense]
MLSGFPASSGTDPDMQIRAYLLAIDGIPSEAVWQAAKLFISGKVKNHNRAFAPSCASFAEQCRRQQAAIEAQSRPRLTRQPETPQPKVAAYKMQLLRDAANGSRSARRKLAEMFPDNPIIAKAARHEEALR